MKKLNKEIILGTVVALFGGFFWYFLKYVFYVGNLTTGCWIAGGILFLLFGIALCLAMLLIDNKKILFSSFVITLILFGLFFNNEPFYYLIGLIILLISFWIAVKKVRLEERVQVNLNFWRIWKRGLPIFITALCLLISLAYYFSPEPARFLEKEIRIPRNTFNLVIEPLEGLIIERLPEGIASLGVEATKVLTSQQIKELRDKYGIEIKNGETLKDLIYKLVVFQINNLTGPYKKFIPFGLAIGLFIILKIISLVYVAIVIILSWLVLKLLMAIKFIRIAKIQKEVESVSL
ncbi:MAG: hypothetical protein ACOZAL_01980 [Patescibacteria group bacterium]